jgi:hypothetical protein
MPEKNKFIAACLALFFSFTSLAPLLAQQSASSIAGMACCKPGAVKCCRKHHHSDSENNGPAFAARTCASDCCHVALGGVATGIFVPENAATWTVEPSMAVLLPALETVVASILAPDTLQQRPPPVLLVA